MRIFHTLLITVLIFVSAGFSYPQAHRDILYQTSTIDALLQGVYDGEIAFRELKQHGDFGLGTFNCLDGEMIALEGEFYQIRADGKVYPVLESTRTPFAVVTFFAPDKTATLNDTKNLGQLEHYLERLLPTKNIFYAIKIEGSFTYAKTRSVPKQSKPYPPLVEVTKNQPIFELYNVEGTMVGFRCPAYIKGINVPGYHFHFVTADRRAGGHVLDIQTRDIVIEIDYTSQFFLVLPGGGEFYELNFFNEKHTDIKEVER